MKILIVDDEPRHCRGMAGMIRSTRSHAEIITAKDGVQGLEAARTERPEIILTDIRMPNMDGLNLLSQLAEDDYKPKVVMLSAYNLFDYAQQALRHGAYDYLLKPVDIDKLEEVLARIEIELSKEAAERREAEWIQDRLAVTATAHRKQLVLEWLFGTLSTDGRRELELTGVHQGEGTIVYNVFRSDQESTLPANIDALFRDVEAVWSSFGDALSVALHVPASGDGRSYRIEMATIVHVASCSLRERRTSLRAELENLSARWASYGRLTHAVGPGCADLGKDASYAYRSAVEANSYLFHDRWKGVLFWEELRHTRKPPSFELDEELLKKSLQEEDASTAIHLCRNAFERLSEEGQTDPAVIKENASFMLTKLKNSLGDRIGTEAVKELTETSVESISACESFSSLMVILDTCLVETHGCWRRWKHDKRELIIDSCVALIQERFMENLSLESVASRYHFNVSYFSTMFKNRTGKSFSDYLIEVRMKRAKELLAGREMKIYEIAACCGYRDTKYFARVFKKHAGMSPENFRHLSVPLVPKDEIL